MNKMFQTDSFLLLNEFGFPCLILIFCWTNKPRNQSFFLFWPTSLIASQTVPLHSCCIWLKLHEKCMKALQIDKLLLHYSLMAETNMKSYY